MIQALAIALALAVVLLGLQHCQLQSVQGQLSVASEKNQSCAASVEKQNEGVSKIAGDCTAVQDKTAINVDLARQENHLKRAKLPSGHGPEVMNAFFDELYPR